MGFRHIAVTPDFKKRLVSFQEFLYYKWYTHRMAQRHVQDVTTSTRHFRRVRDDTLRKVCGGRKKQTKKKQKRQVAQFTRSAILYTPCSPALSLSAIPQFPAVTFRAAPGCHRRTASGARPASSSTTSSIEKGFHGDAFARQSGVSP